MKLLLLGAALFALGGCVVVPPDYAGPPPVDQSAYVPDETWEIRPIGWRDDNRSCLSQRSACQAQLDRCLRGRVDCRDAGAYCEQVQSRCRVFY